LVIPTTDQNYTVRSGDTIYSIARRFGVTQNAIFSANPNIGADGRIFPGQVIVIPGTERKLGTIEVNGYIFPGSDESVVRPALPLLTYLSIFSYQVNSDGSLTNIDDEKWIQIARETESHR
jgi:LysM domain.